MLRIAIVSAWHVHADQYAREFAGTPDSMVTAVWDEEPARGQAFAQKYNAEYEPDYEKLLQRDDVDAVSITSPTNMHKELIVAAANAKKHIFTEKVLALTNEDCAEIKDAIEKNGVKFCISFPHRTFSHNLFVKKAVEEGLIGDVTLLRVRNCHNGAIKNWLPDYFYDEKLCGGGAMMDLGAHPMYLSQWIMGTPNQVTSVFTSYAGKGADDNCVSLLAYKNGAIAISETGFVTEKSPFSLEAYGTEGTILVGGWDDGVKLYTTKAGVEYNGWIKPMSLPAPLETPTLQFVNGVVHGADIHFGVEDGIALTVLMTAAYQSAREGKAIQM